ncbi:MAG: hypothetical protein A2045_12655 [Rhodocyclales bacterium GWA2_65_20]|nr:MAG: hypothetical protein A2045_12655 [Rhodocyclales bacterium GWA2_65_20]
MRRLRARTFLLPLCLMLSGCAATSDHGRMQFVAPQGVGIAYSEVEMQAQLAMGADASCQGKDCEAAVAFRREVRQLGARLVMAVGELAPELNTAVPPFYIWVPAKSDQGTLSSAAGNVAVFDGLREVGFDEPALAFLIAREMGHVLGRHHEENTAASVFFSVAAALVLPVANLIRGAAAAIPATTTLTATTTVASMAGSRILRDTYKPDQLREADMLALRIMVRAGWTPAEVADALQAAEPRIQDEGWMSELLVSKARLDQIAMGPPWLLPAAVADAGVAKNLD